MSLVSEVATNYLNLTLPANITEDSVVCIEEAKIDTGAIVAM